MRKLFQPKTWFQKKQDETKPLGEPTGLNPRQSAWLRHFVLQDPYGLGTKAMLQSGDFAGLADTLNSPTTFARTVVKIETVTGADVAQAFQGRT